VIINISYLTVLNHYTRTRETILHYADIQKVSSNLKIQFIILITHNFNILLQHLYLIITYTRHVFSRGKIIMHLFSSEREINCLAAITFGHLRDICYITN